MHFMAAHQRAEYLQAERAVSMASYSEYSVRSGRNQVTHPAQFMHCTLHSHPTKNRKSPEQSSEVRSESSGIWLWSSLQTRLKSHHTPVTHLWLRCMKQNRVKEFHCSLYLLLKDNPKNPSPSLGQVIFRAMLCKDWKQALITILCLFNASRKYQSPLQGVS